MSHEGVMDGGLWVTGPLRLCCVPVGFRGRSCRFPVVVLEAGGGPLV